MEALVYIAPIATYFLGVATSFWVAYHSRTALLIDSIVDELQRVRDAATPYWCRDSCPEDGVSEAQILGGISTLTTFETEMKGVLGVFHERYSELMLKLIDEASGGDFQTAGRKASFQRAIAIERLLASFQMHLKAARFVEVRILRRLATGKDLQRILLAAVVLATPLAIYFARN
ncbi:hypothetical protein [Maricaulis sp.]|uniref:hypothetical protein n=1 Tax=Maricaulis sp. TaxID=1486257 RepID=UPI003A954465